MSELLVERRGGELRLTLNRPQALNALTASLLAALDAALIEAEAGDVRVVVLGGAGRAFSAGQDLVELESGLVTSYEAHFAKYIPVLRRIRRLPKPVVARVAGVAAGGGMGLALACDLRLASADATFSTAFARIGLVPDSGLTYTLPRLVGPAKAFELLALSPRIGADEALALGIVNRVWPADRFEEECDRLVGELGRGPTLAYGSIKASLERSGGLDFEAALIDEGLAQEAAGRTRDHAEGLAAFRERRPADFQGR
jgi:2-(1,2-epoxy-1,2-dihydrophenyl)acetyl-CoA isomerase